MPTAAGTVWAMCEDGRTATDIVMTRGLHLVGNQCHGNRDAKVSSKGRLALHLGQHGSHARPATWTRYASDEVITCIRRHGTERWLTAYIPTPLQGLGSWRARHRRDDYGVGWQGTVRRVRGHGQYGVEGHA